MPTPTNANQDSSGPAEQEPLLGRPGDASQPDDKLLPYNFILGTGVIAQAGIWILAAIVWASVFSHELILFSAHPLLNSAGLLFLSQGILILQPTHTAKQKTQGTYAHAALNDLGLFAFIGGLVVIEYNKISHGGTHFESPHARLGLITYILVIIQTVIGITQAFVPQVYGGEGNARAMYKYHRMSGYFILLMMFATVSAATQTDFNKNVLHIQLWAVVAGAIITLVGIVPRIKKRKFGF